MLDDLLKQDAIYWPPSSTNRHGAASYGTLQEIKCHWEDKRERYVDEHGEEKTSNAIVFVSVDVLTGGVLWLGVKGDLESEDVPLSNPSARVIQKAAKEPDLDAVEFLRTAIL